MIWIDPPPSLTDYSSGATAEGPDLRGWVREVGSVGVRGADLGFKKKSGFQGFNPKP